MTLNIASCNMRGLRDPSKCAHLLCELSNISVDVVAVQETHFICTKDCQVLEGDFVVFSAFCSPGFSLLGGCSLNVIVNLVFANDVGRLVVADVAIKSFKFWVVIVYTPNSIGKRHSFF